LNGRPKVHVRIPRGKGQGYRVGWVVWSGKPGQSSVVDADYMDVATPAEAKRLVAKKKREGVMDVRYGRHLTPAQVTDVVMRATKAWSRVGT